MRANICLNLIALCLCACAAADVSQSGLNLAPAPSTTCSATLTAELKEGPYYLDDILFRSNITESQPGISVTLDVYLLDTNCDPVVDAFVSIWHANASGIYSGFTGAAASGGVVASQTDELTFLRGMVLTDSAGLATFETIFPGRYTGRSPHIHAKVFVPYANASTTNETAKYLDSHLVHTGQFFSTDAMNTYVQTVSPYSASTQSTVLALAKDSVYNTDTASDAIRQVLSYKEVVSGDASQGLIATIDAIVNTSATYTDTVTAETSSSCKAWLSVPVAVSMLFLLSLAQH